MNVKADEPLQCLLDADANAGRPGCPCYNCRLIIRGIKDVTDVEDLADARRAQTHPVNPVNPAGTANP